MPTSHPRPFNLILLGPPGSGKGTQGQLLEERFSLYHLASGDLIRTIYRHAGQGDALADEIKVRYDAGVPQPDHIILKIVEREIIRLHRKTGFIFDAFPLSVPQAIDLERMVKLYDMREPIAVLIDLTREEAIQRLILRKFCSSCQKVCHPTDAGYTQDHCEACGGALAHRPDDTAELIGKRYDAYTDRLKALRVFYQERGRLLDVHGAQPIAGVFNEILQALVPYL